MESMTLNKRDAKARIRDNMVASWLQHNDYLCEDEKVNKKRALDHISRKVNHWKKYQRLSTSFGWTAYFFFARLRILKTLVDQVDNVVNKVCLLAEQHRTRFETIALMKQFNFASTYDRVFNDIVGWKEVDIAARYPIIQSINPRTLYHTVVNDDLSLEQLDGYEYSECCDRMDGFSEDPQLTGLDDTPSLCKEKCEKGCVCRYPIPPIEIFRTESTGLGIRTLTKVEAFTVLGFYKGTIKPSSTPHNEHYSITGRLQRGGTPYIIDSESRGNWTRLVNHSCEPNSALLSVVFKGKIELALVTQVTVNINEELTVDYGDDYWRTKDYPCLCDSAQCVKPADSLPCVD